MAGSVPLSVIAVAPQSEADGSQMIIVSPDRGITKIEVSVPLPKLEELVAQFQQAAIHRAIEAVRNVALPTLHAYSIQTAHAAQSSQLLLSTDELGAVVIEASDNLLRHLKLEVDKVLSFRGGSSKRQ